MQDKLATAASLGASGVNIALAIVGQHSIFNGAIAVALLGMAAWAHSKHDHKASA